MEHIGTSKVKQILPYTLLTDLFSGFGGLWYPSSRSLHPTEAVGFLGRKNPQHTFLRRGSKAVSPMS